GGHAHAGAMVYLGDSWPEKYRNTIFMNNIHGNRINNDSLETDGSGYKGDRLPDFMKSTDKWYRGLAIKYGPDGSVFVSDWYDARACHQQTPHDRRNGRIYKIVYNDAKQSPVDLARLSDAELVKLQLHKNDWFVRHARRILQERAAAGKLARSTPGALRAILDKNPDVTRKLRALWALHAIGDFSEANAMKLLKHDSEHLRWWAVQFLCEDKHPGAAALEQFARLAHDDPSPMVRLALASALQRLPLEQRWKIVEGLIGHENDAADQNLPLMIWYGI